MSALVSVILPVYNGEGFIKDAVFSILNQSYENIELIIINDGSTDTTGDIIHEIIDSRIRYVSRENRGLVSTLNEAISLAKGTYIARMDADDIAYQERISKQVEFFNNNQDFAICGTRTHIIDESGHTISKCFRPIKDKDIKTYLLYGSPFAHPSVMFNLNIINKEELRYSKDYFPTEDLELWFRLLARYKAYNLKERLLGYRINSTGISSENRDKQALFKQNIQKEHFAENKAALQFTAIVSDFDFSRLFSFFKAGLSLCSKDASFSKKETVLIITKVIFKRVKAKQ